MKACLSVLVDLALLLCMAHGFQLPPSETIRSALFPARLEPGLGLTDRGVGIFPRGSVSLRERGREADINMHMTNGLSDKNRTAGPTRIWIELLKRAFVRVSQIWWLIKKAIRARTEKYTVYVLECENGKYYVGSTSHKRQRFKQHMASERGGSKWTRIHKPIRVARQYKRIPAAYYLGLEAQVTAECMYEYGVNNVRGAMFAQVRQYNTRYDIDALTGFLGHYNDLNYKEVNLILQQTLPSPVEEYVPKSFTRKRIQKKQRTQGNDVCNRCGNRGHWAAECPNNGRCFSCGKIGHYAADCPGT
jgi:predicted GIY-YIG superfamily endonuclease